MWRSSSWCRSEFQAFEAVSNDPFLQALADVVHVPWRGTLKELRQGIRRWLPENDKLTDRSIRGRMMRSAPNLRKAGWTVQEEKTDPAAKRASRWLIIPPGMTVAGYHTEPEEGETPAVG